MPQCWVGSPSSRPCPFWRCVAWLFVGAGFGRGFWYGCAFRRRPGVGAGSPGCGPALASLVSGHQLWVPRRRAGFPFDPWHWRYWRAFPAAGCLASGSAVVALVPECWRGLWSENCAHDCGGAGGSPGPSHGAGAGGCHGCGDSRDMGPPCSDPFRAISYCPSWLGICGHFPGESAGGRCWCGPGRRRYWGRRAP